MKILVQFQIGKFSFTDSNFSKWKCVYHFIYHPLNICLSSSSLASIFQNSSGIQDTSKSLVYTAPKQPLNKITEGSKPSLPKGVLALAAVSVYKL